MTLSIISILILAVWMFGQSLINCQMRADIRMLKTQNNILLQKIERLNPKEIPMGTAVEDETISKLAEQLAGMTGVTYSFARSQLEKFRNANYSAELKEIDLRQEEVRGKNDSN